MWTGGIGNLATPVLIGVHYPLWQIMGCLRFKRSRFPHRFLVGLWRGTPCPFVDLSALNRLRGSSGRCYTIALSTSSVVRQIDRYRPLYGVPMTPADPIP